MNANKLHDERKTGIGGSDVAACFNLDRGCARRLVYEKRGTVPNFPDPYRPEYERGQDLEPVAIRKFEREQQVKVVNNGGFFRRADYPHMICHVDGVIIPESGQNGLLEIKVLNQWNLKRIKKEGLLDAYILQLQHGLYTTGLPWGQWGLLCPDPWELHVLPKIEMDSEIISRIIEREGEVWKQVTEGPMPDKLDPTDNRCQVCPFRKTCQGSEMMQVLPQADRGVPLESAPDAEGIAQEYWQAREIEEEAKALKEDAGKRLKALIGKRPGVKYPGGRFILSKSYPKRWDTEALWASLDMFPLLEDYIKTTPEDKPQLTLRGYRTGD